MEYNKVSLLNVVNGRAHDIDGNWVDMPDEDRDYYFELFRAFLLKTCRRGSEPNRIISRVSYYDIGSYGIYDRLEWTEKYGVEYIAGQSYPEEIAYIKQLIMK